MGPRRPRRSPDQPAGALSRGADSFGFLRLLLALCVVLSHVYPLAVGRLDPLWRFSGAQTDIGKLAVVGFFVLSGFMITGSGRRSGVGRYCWHRALRILPGLVGSLLVSVLVLAPLMFHHEHGSLDGYWNHPRGPLHYLTGPWHTSLTNDRDVSDVVAEGVRRGSNFDGSINGALWSLRYEALCYALVGLLAAAGVLRRARRLVPLAAAALGLTIAADWVGSGRLRGIPGDLTSTVDVPALGPLYVHHVTHLCFVFLLGATFELYRDHVRIRDGWAVVAAVVLPATLYWGGLFVIGYPALAYLLFWLAFRLPRPFRRIGRRCDLSYGLYIYGFTVEQTLAVFGFIRYGKVLFLVTALACTAVLAAFSWFAVEAPAMRLRGWTPALPPLLRRPAPRGPQAEPPAVRTAEDPKAQPSRPA